MIRRWRQFSIREKIIFLILFAVLLPTIILFAAQYRMIAELREKSKSAFEHNLRQTYFEIGNKIDAALLENAETILRDFPETALQNPESQQIKQDLNKILENRQDIESAFVFTKTLEKVGYLAIKDSEGFLDAPINTSPKVWFQTVQTEDFIKPFVSSSQAPFNQINQNNYITAQQKCEKCEENGQTEILYYYRLFPATERQTEIRFIGAKANQKSVVEKIIVPVITEIIQNSLQKGDDLVFGIFDGQDRLIYSNLKPDEQLGNFEIESPLRPNFPLWTIKGGYRSNSIESLSTTYYRQSLLLMVLVFGLLILGVALIFRVTAHEVSLAQSKAAFVSNVSHELKTPLALIRLFAETLQSGRVKNAEKANEYYGIISNETNRLTQLINNILDFSAIEAGRKDYKFTSENLSEVAAEVVQNYSYAMENTGFTVETNFAENLPTVLIDRDAISQAILNLLNNAVKYSGEEKFVEVIVKKAGESISLTVTDHGIGIASEEQKKIFEDFYRVGGSSDVHNVKGSGLGLALVKHIIKAHGGTVSVNSVAGRGSTFTILLPSKNSNGKH